MKLVGISSLVLALVSIGCVGPVTDEDLDIGESQSDLLSPNGVSLNGTGINGTGINGTGINGTGINGTGINGTGINGTVLTNPTLATSTVDVVGSHWIAGLSNGGTLDLRIDAKAALPAPNATVISYQVSYANGTEWSPLCGLDSSGHPIAALAMSGVWSYEQGVAGGGAYTADTSKITFACRGKAIAKCIEMGYRPGTEAAKTERLVACTRMLRADYCGDGRSFTVDGTLINLYDNVGIQADTQPWAIEAEWTSAGARCTNAAPLTRLTVSGLTPPSCFAAKVSTSCGDLAHFATGTTLMNEFAH